MSQRTCSHVVSKERWYDTQRKRFWSHMHNLTDEQIEEGIRELDSGILEGMDRVILPDVMNYVCAWK